MNWKAHIAVVAIHFCVHSVDLEQSGQVVWDGASQ